MDFLKWCRNEWERSTAVAFVVLGLLAFTLGFFGLRDKSLVTEQVPYVVSGALFGLFLLGIGTTMWLSADLHDEWVKLDRLEDVVSRSNADDAARHRPTRAAESVPVVLSDPRLEEPAYAEARVTSNGSASVARTTRKRPSASRVSGA
ncbi:MAG: hypothetical protein JWM64_944 [Frankiales bacterium]|nr:hypothetical protein [Frankiales bacterium]